MARNFELVVFDWDGTLMDSAAAIVTAIQSAARDLGLPIPDENRARHVIGLGLKDALQHAVPELAESQYGEMVDAYRRHYLSRDNELTLFPGVGLLLSELSNRGVLLAVATGKSRVGLDRALQGTGIGQFFSATRCADECFSKPHPQMLLELLDELGVDPARALMVGDTTHDLQMADAAAVASLAVSYGAHSSTSLAEHQVLACLDSPLALSEWLLCNA